MFSADEKKRYARQLSLVGFGPIAQSKLKEAKVMVVGAGGLGSPVLQYLASQGVGNIKIIDGDHVDETNLHRQVLYQTSDIGKSKASVAEETLRKLNPYIQIISVKENINADNAIELLDDCSIILDCSDNFSTKFLCNDLAFFKNCLLIQASVFQYEGNVTVLKPFEHACLRCLYGNFHKYQAENCSENGILGIAPAIVGSWQALEATKLIAQIQLIESSYFLRFNLLDNTLKKYKIEKDPSCSLCGNHPSIINIEQTKSVACSSSFSVNCVIENSKVIDIRESKEYENNPSNYINIPLSEIKKDIHILDMKQSYTFVCASGKRSIQLCNDLSQLGFKDVYGLNVDI